MSEQTVGPATQWKWFTAAAPSIGWDAAFLAPEDLLTNPEKYDRIPIRGLGKLEIVKDKTTGKPVLELHRNLPAMFGCVDVASDGLVDRKLFTWIFAATPAAADDWTKMWNEPLVGLDLVDGSEAEAEELAAQARQKAALAKALKKGGPMELIK